MYESGLLVNDCKLNVNRDSPFFVGVRGAVIPVILLFEDLTGIVEITGR